VREIIDAVKPTRTFYALETMQWVFPDSVESYVRLVASIDRPQFGVHFDPVNLITSPRLYFSNATLIKAFLRELGPHIKSCHAKDVLLEAKLGLIMSEVIPGTGALDYAVFVRGLQALDADMPLMLEHLSSEADYATAAAHIRSVQ
jgi:sugar phosphate isomerase/epimerase